VRSALFRGPGPGPLHEGRRRLHGRDDANPSKIIEHQIGYWGKTLKHYVEAQQACAGQARGPARPIDTPKDRRFSNPLWETHPYFNYIKQQYLMNAEAIERGGDSRG
jgi:polyhydroxyalkanoate synthase subunit PhaC